MARVPWARCGGLAAPRAPRPRRRAQRTRRGAQRTRPSSGCGSRWCRCRASRFPGSRPPPIPYPARHLHISYHNMLVNNYYWPAAGSVPGPASLRVRLSKARAPSPPLSPSAPLLCAPSSAADDAASGGADAGRAPSDAQADSLRHIIYM